LSHTSVGNRLGLCAISLPCGRDELGLPVGLMLMGAAGRDRELMEVALAAEGVLGTAKQRLGEAPLTAG
jgi:aspartyl-tRNA(Asn)/glutamyl-tRNA(Gln) amidotransferase subunit A